MDEEDIKSLEFNNIPTNLGTEKFLNNLLTPANNDVNSFSIFGTFLFTKQFFIV